MLTKEQCEVIEASVLERINGLYPKESLLPVISKIAVQATLLTLQEYEKIQSQP